MMQAQRRRFGFGLGLVLARHVPLQKRAACLGPTGLLPSHLRHAGAARHTSVYCKYSCTAR